MKRIALTILLSYIASFAFACECGQSLGSYFLKHVKDFDAIVKGKIYREPGSGKGYLIIEKVYKGTFAEDRLELSEGGTDCTEVFREETGKTLVLGLFKSSYASNPQAYAAPSCITSVLVVTDDEVEAKNELYNLSLAKPKIGLHSASMSKKKFEKEVIKRL